MSGKDTESHGALDAQSVISQRYGYPNYRDGVVHAWQVLPSSLKFPQALDINLLFAFHTGVRPYLPLATPPSHMCSPALGLLS